MAVTEPSVHASTQAAITPAPWDLVGRGALLLLRPAAGQRHGLLDLGATLTFVDYERSGVDPYLELLHTPRFTHVGGTIGPTIDRIWVTSARSVASGRANWAIPKDLAQITRTDVPSGTERWTASLDGELLASATLRPVGPRLPAYKPRAGGRLLQRMDGVLYRTPISCSGRVQFAAVEQLDLGPTFADIYPARVRGALLVPRFRMGFHEATIG